ncbi:MAG: TOBE domain-containing protein, partial [Desulfobacteraceae bacterium]
IVYVTHDQVEAMTLGDRVVVMREGKIHQIGSPDTIYAHPADRFVASFIGSPEMNLYRGKLLIKHGRPHFQGAGFSLDLGDVQQSPVEDEVELGIRPEDIGISPDSSVPPRAHVDMISNMGSEMLVYARLGEESVTLRAPKDISLRPGEPISLAIDPRRVHVFHKGQRL